MKKVLCITLLIIITLSVIPVFAASEEVVDNIKYIISDGKARVTGYTPGLSRDVIIPGNVKGFPVTEIDTKAFYCNEEIRSVTISEGIINISYSAFEECINLETVNLPESLKTIDIQAFQRCTSLNTIRIPDSVEEIKGLAFFGCKELKKVTLGKSVKYIGNGNFGGTFAQCISLKEINLPDSLLYLDSNVFKYCVSLTHIHFPENLETIGTEVFYGCDNLRSVTIDDENKHFTINDKGIIFNKNKTEIITVLPYATGSIELPQEMIEVPYALFSGSSVEKVILHEDVEKIGELAFCNCSNLSDIIIPNKVLQIEGLTFKGCHSLNMVILSEGVKYLNIGAFYDCSINTLIIESDEINIEREDIEERRVWPSSFHETTIGVIYGHVGSDAEKYANEMGIKFVPLEEEIAIIIDDAKLECDSKPYIKNDRTLVPMRAIFEALGASVSWDDATKTATGVKDNVEVEITIGENVLYKNGEAIELDCVAEITNDRTMVPARAISEAFGCTVNWNNEMKTVEITK